MEAAASGRPRVLFVDDERLIRTAYQRQLRGRVDVVTAESADEALALITAGPPFAAVVSDLQMPGTDGLTLLSRVKDLCPGTMRVLFTGKADLRCAAQAVNDVGVFRILLKPCPPAQLWECIESAVAQFAQHGGRAAARTADAAETIGLLQALVTAANPALHARATRLRRLVHHVCVALSLPHAGRFELAAWLSGISLVSADTGTIDRFTIDRPGDDAERARFHEAWSQAAAILAHVHALHDVAGIVAEAAGPVSTTLATDPIVLGGQVLRTAAIADGLFAGGSEPDAVLASMRTSLAVPEVLVNALATLPALPMRTRLVECDVARLEPGMVIEDAVRSATGVMLVPSGRVLTSALIQLINGYARTLGVPGTLLVRTLALPSVDAAAPEPAALAHMGADPVASLAR